MLRRGIICVWRVPGWCLGSFLAGVVGRSGRVGMVAAVPLCSGRSRLVCRVCLFRFALSEASNPLRYSLAVMVWAECRSVLPGSVV